MQCMGKCRCWLQRPAPLRVFPHLYINTPVLAPCTKVKMRPGCSGIPPWLWLWLCGDSWQTREMQPCANRHKRS